MPNNVRHIAIQGAVSHNYLFRCVRAIVLAAALLYFFGLVGRIHWLADLCANFLPHLTAVTLGCFLILVLKKSLRWVTAAALLFAVEIIMLGPYLMSSELKANVSETGEKLRILQFNVSKNNLDWRSFIDWLEPQLDSIDILILLENTPDWRPAVKVLAKEFRDHLEVVRTDSYGLAVFSQLPRSESKVRFLGSKKVPVIELRGHVGEQPLTLIAAHTTTPLGKERSDIRNAQLYELAAWVKNATTEHKILIGDLNVTPFSYWFHELLETTNLVDAQVGFGLLPTWAPDAVPILLGLPIDHTLISNRFIVVSRICSERLGSDHCPVKTDLRVSR